MKENNGGYPEAWPYCRAVVRSIFRRGSAVPDTRGTTIWADVLTDSEIDASVSFSEILFRRLGLFGVGLNLSGSATEASSVS